MTVETNRLDESLVDSDWFFLLDFSSRYVVSQCGGRHNVQTGLMSMMIILPVWIWFGTLTLSLTKPEIYAMVAKYTIGIITILQFAFMLVFYQTSPIPGCGPSRSFPCIQTSLSAYGTCMFALFDSSLRRQGAFWRVIVVLQLIAVTSSVSWLGFASPASVLAGAFLGSCVGCALHLSMIALATPHHNKNEKEDKPIILRVMSTLENVFGTITVDTLLVDSSESDKDDSHPLPPPIYPPPLQTGIPTKKTMAQLPATLPVSMSPNVAMGYKI